MMMDSRNDSREAFYRLQCLQGFACSADATCRKTGPGGMQRAGQRGRACCSCRQQLHACSVLGACDRARGFSL
jgi:hypothetical protein